MGLFRAALCFFLVTVVLTADWGGILPWEEKYDNPDGKVSIKNRGGAIRTQNHAFFDPLGTNGRALH